MACGCDTLCAPGWPGQPTTQIPGHGLCKCLGVVARVSVAPPGKGLLRQRMRPKLLRSGPPVGSPDGGARDLPRFRRAEALTALPAISVGRPHRRTTSAGWHAELCKKQIGLRDTSQPQPRTPRESWRDAPRMRAVAAPNLSPSLSMPSQPRLVQECSTPVHHEKSHGDKRACSDMNAALPVPSHATPSGNWEVVLPQRPRPGFEPQSLAAQPGADGPEPFPSLSCSECDSDLFRHPTPKAGAKELNARLGLKSDGTEGHRPACFESPEPKFALLGSAY